MTEAFQPKSLITRMFLGLLAAAAMPNAIAKPGLRPFVAEAKPKEAAHSARHDRRRGHYVGAVTRTINQGRSRPCPCGSGKKYKRCHLSIDTAEAFRRQHGFAAVPARATGKTLAKAA